MERDTSPEGERKLAEAIKSMDLFKPPTPGMRKQAVEERPDFRISQAKKHAKARSKAKAARKARRKNKR